MAAAPSHPRSSTSTFKLQDGVPAQADLEDMRLQTDALVSSFNERYRDAILTPSHSSSPHTPSYKSSIQSNTARSEPATVVRFPISSPSNLAIGRSSNHPLSHAHHNNASPSSMRQTSAAPPAPSASSSDQIYFRAMLTQAHAETNQVREALTCRDHQLAQANAQIGELRRAIALRDGCLEHANSVVAQLQEHKLHLYSIIDNFRAQQASSKSQLDLQARSLISKERHIFALTEKIQRVQLESANHQSSCEEALKFMLQECQSASRDRDAALGEVVSLRLQITDSKSFKGSSSAGSLGSASRKAMLASLDVGSNAQLPGRHDSSTKKIAHGIQLDSKSHGGETGRHSNFTESPSTRDHVVDFYLAHSHEKRPYTAMYGTRTSPAGTTNHRSPDYSKKKLLDLFGDVSSARTSQDGGDSDQPDYVEAQTLEQDIADHNSQISSNSLLGSFQSTPALQPNSSASKSKASLASSSVDNEAGVFTNQHRRRSAARSLASECSSRTQNHVALYFP
jgi:hypothetical protein